MKMKGLILSLTGLFLMAQLAMAQDVAFFSSIKGKVTITDASGKAKAANMQTKLMEGDKIVTGNDGSVTIMYYTGKEVVVGNNKTYSIVKTKQEQNSFLSGLYSSLSGMLWGETSGTSMAGATRAWAGDANRLITATYPSETKILESEPVFKWMDHRKTSTKEYVIQIKSEISDFKYEINVSGVNEAVYPKTAPKLKNDERYVWTVKDAKGTDISPQVGFTLINSDDRNTMEDDLKEILKVCNGDNTNPQWYLLTAALYRDYGLMKQAENSILALIALKPDMAQAHIMLATLYKETGRLEEAKIAEETARKLSEAGKK